MNRITLFTQLGGNWVATRTILVKSEEMLQQQILQIKKMCPDENKRRIIVEPLIC